jgi:hypothetical protein
VGSSTFGLSVAAIEGRLNGPNGRRWRLVLKQRCPAVMAHPRHYDSDLVGLCRLVGLSKTRVAVRAPAHP